MHHLAEELHMCVGRRVTIGLALLLGLSFLANSARASVEIFDANNALTNLTSVTMAQLQSGYSIQVDDKLFFNWTGYGSTISGAGLGAVVDAASITVTGLDADPLNPGVNYQSGAWAITAGQIQDTKWQYDVAVVGGANIMEDASMTLLSGNVGGPTSAINITEQLSDGMGNLVAPLSVFELQLPGSFTSQIFDEKFFTPVNFVQVNKDVALSMSANATGITSFSDMSQNFSQVATPEPSSLAISVVCALGMISYGLRRRRGI